MGIRPERDGNRILAPQAVASILTELPCLLLNANSYYTTGGFGVLEVACWPLVPKFAGSHPAEAVGFLGRKNPQHAFLRRGSKAVGPMS